MAKKKLSPYNRHVQAEMKKGKTMAQAAASWRKKKGTKKKPAKRKPAKKRKKAVKRKPAKKKKTTKKKKSSGKKKLPKGVYHSGPKKGKIKPGYKWPGGGKAPVKASGTKKTTKKKPAKRKKAAKKKKPVKRKPAKKKPKKRKKATKKRAVRGSGAAAHDARFARDYDANTTPEKYEGGLKKKSHLKRVAPVHKDSYKKGTKGKGKKTVKEWRRVMEDGY